MSERPVLINPIMTQLPPGLNPERPARRYRRAVLLRRRVLLIPRPPWPPRV